MSDGNMTDNLEAMYAAAEAANGDSNGTGAVAETDTGAPAGEDGKPKKPAQPKKPAKAAKPDAPGPDDLDDGEDGRDGGEGDDTGDDGFGNTDTNDAGADADDGDDGDDAKGKRGKTRSKPLTTRLSEETARRREAEQRASDLEARFAALEARLPKDEAPAGPVEPKPEDFEFGDADTAYQAAHSKWLIESTLAKRDAEREEAARAERVKAEFASSMKARLAEAEAAGKERYDDFDERIAEAVAQRGQLSRMTATGIAISPVGGDLAYRLATDEDASDRLERLAAGGERTASAFAMAFGELEGEYIEGTDDSDLDVTDQMDMARMMGRMRARLANGSAGRGRADDDDDGEVIPFTKAPVPPEKRLRGGNGRSRTAEDTDDPVAFYREFGGQLG